MPCAGLDSTAGGKVLQLDSLSDPLLSPPHPPFSIHNPFPIPIHVFFLSFNFFHPFHLLFLYHELNCRSFFCCFSFESKREREREEKVVWILESAGKQQKHSFTFNPPFLFPPKNDDDDDERVDGMMMMRLSLFSVLLFLHLMMARIAIIKSSLSQFIPTFHSPSLSSNLFPQNFFLHPSFSSRYVLGSSFSLS